MPGDGSSRWQWPEQLLIPLAAAGMRAAWLAPVLHLVLNNPLVWPRAGAYPWWLIMALLLGAAATQAVAGRWRWGPLLSAIVGVTVVLGAVAWRLEAQPLGLLPVPLVLRLMLAFDRGLPSGLLLFLITAMLWYRGLAGNWHEHTALWRGFVQGVLMLAAMLLLFGGVPARRAELQLIPATIGFLLSGLAGLALASAAESVSLEEALTGQRVAASRYWWLAVGSVVLVALGVGWFLGQALAPEALAGLLDLLRPAASLVGRALLWALAALAYVVFWLLSPLINWLRARIAEMRGAETEPYEPFGDPMEGLEGTAFDAASPAMVTLRWVALGVLVLGLVLLFVLAWRRGRRRALSDVVETRELIWSRSLLQEQWREFARSLRRRRRRAPYLPLNDPSDGRQAVRLLYQRLLARAAARGQPRPPGVTPAGYGRLLARAWGNGETAEALGLLTAAYIQARYGPEAPDPDTVEAARRAWRAIEAAWPAQPEDGGASQSG